MPESDEKLEAVFRTLYGEWIAALQQRRYEWFEEHIAQDFSASTHPYPGVTLNKSQFIEGEKKIESVKGRTLEVHVHSIEGITVTVWFAFLEEEKLSESESFKIFGPQFPSAEALNDLVRNKTMAYADSWRNENGVWRCFNHHMIGPAN